MTPARAIWLGITTSAIVLALAFTGFAVGHAQRTSARKAAAVKTKFERQVFAASGGRALARMRAIGYARGLTAGHKSGTVHARTDAVRDAKRSAPVQPAAVASSANTPAATKPQPCPTGQYTTAAGSCAADPPGFGGTPPVNSPEGQAMIAADPTCQNPPPPPGYSGPVQCNNP